MIAKPIKKKGILNKLLEKAIKVLLQKECNNIEKLTIDIIGSSIQIIKGEIQKIHIKAEEINYKDLLFDKIVLVANKVKIILKISNKEVKLKNNLELNFEISLSETSLNKTLLSQNWIWIGNSITREILNKGKLEDIKINNNQILIKASEERNTIVEEARVDINLENGKIYLRNKDTNKSSKIPIEDKIYIKNINITNNSINIFANSTVSF